MKPPRPCTVLLDPDGYVCGVLSRDGKWSRVPLVKGFTAMEYGPIRKPRSKGRGRIK